MEVKEAIEVFWKIYTAYPEYEDDLYEVVSLIQRGEAYEKMWGELKKIHGDGAITTYYVDVGKGETKKELYATKLREFMEVWEEEYLTKEEEHPTPYADRGLDGTMDWINEFRKENLKEIVRLEALIKEKNKCDHCGYKQIVTSLKDVWGKLTP